MKGRFAGFLVLALTVAAGTPGGALESNGMTLQGMTLQGMTLQGMTLQGMTMQGSTLQGRTMQGMSLQGSTMQGMSMQGMNMQGTNMQGTNMQGTNMQGTNMQGMSMQGGDLQGRSLSGTTLRGAALAGGRLQVRTAAGALLEGDQLDGTDLPMVAADGSTRWVHVDDASPDPDGRDLTFLTLSHDGKNVCADGGPGLLVPGAWDEHGARAEQSAAIDTTFSCMSGVVAKCVMWGYEPWDGPVHAELHATCTRMARADYCGDSVPHTENGTTIDLFDVRGIQRPANAAGMSFEAGWGPEGAVCVSRPRYVDVDAAGQTHLPSCWASKPRCDDWTEATAHGATLGNRSYPLERRLD